MRQCLEACHQDELCLSMFPSYSIVVLSEHEEFPGQKMIVLILKERRRSLQIIQRHIAPIFQDFFY